MTPPARCRVSLGPPAPAPGSWSAEGQGATADEAEAAAWAALAGQLPEAERPHLRDVRRYSASVLGAPVAGSSPRRFEAHLRVQTASSTFDAEAEAPGSIDAACEAARTQACAQAGAPPDCVAHSGFRVVSSGPPGTPPK